ncbi:MAG: hypothetical protein WBL68_03785 [Nitrososphaeraceae archaeon]
MTLDYWNRQIEIWMDVFSDDKPDLMALEIVREFDNLTKKFYGIFDDLNEWASPQRFTWVSEVRS